MASGHNAQPELGLGPGAALPPREKRFFERRLGAILDGVRVHVDSAAAQRLGARAFAAGRDIGFAPGEWSPQTTEGQRLLGHELAHVVQQGNHGPAVQLEEAPQADALKKTNDAADVLTEGLMTVLDKAKDQEGIKALLTPAKTAALGQWGKLSTGEKAAVAGLGAGTYGLALGAGLGDPSGRKQLSGVNLAAPLGLIPYSTLTDFRYVPPPSGTGPALFNASFSGNDLLELAHDKLRGVPSMSLSFDLSWRVDPAGAASLTSAKANWGVLPGVSLQAGSGVGLDWKPTVTGADGQVSTIMKSLPAQPGPGPGSPAPPGVGVFLSVDLLKAPFVPTPIRAALGAEPAAK